MVSPVALGCWPIAGVTTLDVNDADSIATIQKCFDVGINHLDTAMSTARTARAKTLSAAHSVTAATKCDRTKCGIHYENGPVTDNRPSVCARMR